MLIEFISEHGAALAVIAVTLVMFALFVGETLPTEVVALLGATFLLASGILPHDKALEVFSNPAPWTIVAMFILSGALVRTGLLNSLSENVAKVADESPSLVLVLGAGVVVASSAFMNNTPVVLVLIPVVIALSTRLGITPSKLLIPLSYMSIFGGMCTLIGTSTNLLVDGAAQSAGLEPFTLFEVTPLAVILAAYGILYLRLAGPHLLPSRESLGSLLRDRQQMKFFTEIVLPEGSALAGQNAFEVDLFRRHGVRIVDVLRGEQPLRDRFPDVVLQANDRVVLRTDATEVLGLHENREVLLADKVSSRETKTVETLVSPRSKMVGRTVGSLKLVHNFGIYLLAIHRPKGKGAIGKLDHVRLRVGDTLLMEGVPADIRKFAVHYDVTEIEEPDARPYRRSKAPIAILTMAAMVLLAAVGIMPIYALALIAVAVVLVTGCIDTDEGFSFINGQLMALIFAMLAIGAAMESSGAIVLIANLISPLFLGLHPVLLVWFVYLLTSALTEMISNNAVAVVMTPIAVGLGTALGVDPRPLVVAVMVAASASFATPIGYQTNTLVYGPGGYSFVDFMKIGLPLNISVGILASLLIPLFWPL